LEALSPEARRLILGLAGRQSTNPRSSPDTYGENVVKAAR
jgi:hypothetical protein